MSKLKTIGTLVLCSFLTMCTLVGCRSPREGGGSPVQVVLTTGFQKDEVFRLEEKVCRLPEALVYMSSLSEKYLDAYGSPVFEIEEDGERLADNLKEVTLARISAIKAVSRLAEEYDIELDEEELAGCQAAAAAYWEALTERDRETLRVNREDLEKMYREVNLAQKVYAYIIRDINPEISDDEARTIVVQHILLKTVSLDEEGRKEPLSEDEKQKQRKLAEEIHRRVVDNPEEFESLMQTYSQSDQGTYSFRKGELEGAFSDVAFNLAKDEISAIVETQEGYEIIKCLSTFDREETERNKIRIVEERRQETFYQKYDSYARGLTGQVNEKLWQTIEPQEYFLESGASFFSYIRF